MVKGLKILCRSCGTENDAEEEICQRCGLSLALIEPDSCERKTVCPKCQNISNAGSFFCYTCGKYFADTEELKTGKRTKKRGEVAQFYPAPKAKVIIPGGAEIILTGDPVFIERSDFDNTLPYDILMSISRQHILITYSKGKYYLQDYGREGKGSTNHTKLNGSDIYNKRKRTLKDGDKIELAGLTEINMTFRMLKES